MESNEGLDLALQNLPLRDICTASLCCRQWASAARELLQHMRADLSRGLEPRFPVPCINVMGDEQLPLDFVYVAGPPPQAVTVGSARCDCKGGRCKRGSCGCAGAAPAVSEDGTLLEPDTLAVQECGPACPCAGLPPERCASRTTQQGLGVALELTKSSKGWGVHARQAIPRGTFVCEYVGQYITTAEARARLAKYDASQRYSGCRAAVHQAHDGQTVQPRDGQVAQPHDGQAVQPCDVQAVQPCDVQAVQPRDGQAVQPRDGQAVRPRNGQAVQTRDGQAVQPYDNGGSGTHAALRAAATPYADAQEAAEGGRPRAAAGGHALLVVRQVLPSGLSLRANIDATCWGNVARFFNHSCDGGNLSLVLVHRRGCLLPAVALFARRDVAVGQELTFAYGPPNPGPSSAAVAAVAQPPGYSSAGSSAGGVAPLQSYGPRRCLCGTSACLGWMPAEGD